MVYILFRMVYEFHYGWTHPWAHNFKLLQQPNSFCVFLTAWTANIQVLVESRAKERLKPRNITSAWYYTSTVSDVSAHLFIHSFVRLTWLVHVISMQCFLWWLHPKIYFNYFWYGPVKGSRISVQFVCGTMSVARMDEKAATLKHRKRPFGRLIRWCDTSTD